VNRHVNAITGRLSLRPPQRRSLEILDRIAEIVPPRKAVDLTAAAIRSEFPTVTDFEREFPSLCFALATAERSSAVRFWQSSNRPALLVSSFSSFCRQQS